MFETSPLFRDLEFFPELPDQEDALLEGELPCPAACLPETFEDLSENREDSFALFERYEDDEQNDDTDIEPDDPDAAGFPEEDEGACEDECDLSSFQENPATGN